MDVTRIFLGGNNHNDGKRWGLSSVADSVTAAGFPGATLTPAHGLWEGKLEETWVIELWGADPSKVNTLAAALKAAFKQEAIAIEHKGEVSLV